ncbi:hypothetical protein CONLIGDRAFT_644689 [Coniochaeta ligniaria NRRL 30616]|uniref:Uncharacterized protein n=1 Tax=Coniochaeta ligniaria NRRL 30616 TaxID=1408157 RepID=A0A1J7IMA4_9PEZI|nr:hypothetical protein CONLIGDRAFT_644689 [Coniochaeta ligniaria NRRL 30616]
MNWTEGKLARHSRARQGKQSKQTLLRQKEHFAKARAGLLPNASKQTPPSVPLFPSAVSRHTEDSTFAAMLHHTTAPVDIPERLKRPRLSSSPRGHPSTGRPVSSHHFGQRKIGPRDPDPSSAGGLDDTAIREKRRKLLREHDWAGIRMQKPIPVRFEQNPSGESKWNRRRRSTASRARHLIGDRYGQLRNVNDSIEHPQRTQDVRVTVGSQEVRLGEGSSILQPDHLPMAHEALQTYRGAHMPVTFLTSSSASEFTNGHIPMILLNSCPSVTDPKEKLKTGSQRKAQRSSSFTSISESSRSHHAKDDSGRRRHLKAPIPVRHLPGLHMSLISGSLDHGPDDSMVAQVGQPVSPIPSSRIEDNEVWRRFAALSQSNAGQGNSALDESNRFEQPRISPGVSTRCQRIISAATSQHPPVSSGIMDASGSYQRTSSYDSPKHDAYFRQAMSSAGGQSVSHPSTNVSTDGQGTVSYDSIQSGSASVSGVYDHSAEDNDSRRQAAGDTRSSLSAMAASPSSEATGCPSRDADLEHGDSSDSTDSETDCIDQRVAGLRELALKLVSPRAGTPWRNEEKASVDQSTGSFGDFNAEINVELPKEPPHAAPSPAERAATEVVHEQSPNQHSDDIWFKYVFSDTNTDDLHKQVLAEARKDYTGSPLGQADGEDSCRITESDFGHNISTAATHWQPSNGATETGDDLTSTSAAPASHIAAIGSPFTTRTPGTAFDEWEGSGGPPYAAPTMQGSISSGTTHPGQQDRYDNVSTSGQVLSQGITDITSSFSSRVAEPARSVAENAPTKENFIFAPPKLFVGKLSESVASDRPIVAVKPVTQTKPKRGRPKRKARDGRANIKSIPVYHDDPIEEFDELEAQARVEKSLFGALDME